MIDFSPLFLDFAECTGQNFVDGDGQNNANNETRAKRLKTALADNSNHDQVIYRIYFLSATVICLLDYYALCFCEDIILIPGCALSDGAILEMSYDTEFRH